MNGLFLGLVSGFIGGAVAAVLVVGGVTTYKSVSVSNEQPDASSFTTYADE